MAQAPARHDRPRRAARAAWALALLACARPAPAPPTASSPLVFDGLGPDLDRPDPSPSTDPALGAAPTAPATIAPGLTGRRARRALTIDVDRRRVVEEVEIDLASTRPAPVDVRVREHLYRGLNWALAYHGGASAPPVQEGPQQISLPVRVPPRGRARILYVVVYTWP